MAAAASVINIDTDRSKQHEKTTDKNNHRCSAWRSRTVSGVAGLADARSRCFRAATKKDCMVAFWDTRSNC